MNFFKALYIILNLYILYIILFLQQSHGILQRILREMSIPLSHFYWSMAHQFLNWVNRHALHRQLAGKVMPHAVPSKILDFWFLYQCRKSSLNIQQFGSVARENIAAFPSITGIDAKAPRFPSPKIAEPSLTIAIVLRFKVYYI